MGTTSSMKWLILVSMMIGSVSVQAQLMKISGIVMDGTDRSPLVGATIFVKKSSIENVSNAGTISDLNGKYAIDVAKGDTICVEYIGYVRFSAVVGDSVRIDVAMLPSAERLEECVVVGMGTQKQLSIVGAAYAANYDQLGQEEYRKIDDNCFKWVQDSPLSTFSIDVDAASYANMRRFLNKGEMPPKDAIRVEELVNYFYYDYPAPDKEGPVKINIETGDCPWNKKHRLVRIGLKAREIDKKDLPPSNLVFLIDVSGSMWGPNRLGLVKSSLKLLVNNLRAEDRVAIVVYAGAAGEKLPSVSGSDKQKIRDALEELQSGGSTAGGEGIKLAYEIARKNFIEKGNNRVILCTDGDFNVGVTGAGELEDLIVAERKSGVFLTVLGYGMGNYKDNKMQVLAEKGNGNHAYIDNMQEAAKVLIHEFGGTLHTVGKDVKLQVEFNPVNVQAYRLIGYESRLLENKDFNDDKKDAGEIGAGHTVTAFYEVVPTGVESTVPGSVDALKYQKPAPVKNNSPELLTVKLRYKEPDGDVSKKIEVPHIDSGKDNVSSDFRFASSVAMFGQLLRDSEFKGDADYDKVISYAQKGLKNDKDGYRSEFIRLVQTVIGLEK